MPRFNITMPQELWDAVTAEASRSAGGNRSFVVRRALEAALGGSGADHATSGDTGGPGRTPAPAAHPASPRAPEVEWREVKLLAFKCPTHGCDFTAAGSKARCPHHSRTVVPA